MIVSPRIECPWCGHEDLERRGAHWFCLCCAAYWLAWNENDKRLLRALHIAPC